MGLIQVPPVIVALLLVVGSASVIIGAVVRRESSVGLLLLQGFMGGLLLVLDALTLTALGRCATTPPGASPEDDKWLSGPGYLGRQLEAATAIGEESVNEGRREDHGTVRYCKHCRRYKPDRAHHCRQLGHCVLRMDHFCPFVGNTVGFRNHKFFVLFCFWLGVTCLVAVGVSVLSLGLRTGFNVLVWDWRDILLVGASAMGLSTGLTMCMFVGQHVLMLRRNQTTLESMRRDYRWDMHNWRANVEEVFGKSAWLLPVDPDEIGDGITFGAHTLSAEGF